MTPVESARARALRSWVAAAVLLALTALLGMHVVDSQTAFGAEPVRSLDGAHIHAGGDVAPHAESGAHARRPHVVTSARRGCCTVTLPTGAALEPRAPRLALAHESDSTSSPVLSGDGPPP